MAAYAFGGLPLGFVLYGAPIYLGQRLGCDQATLGHLLFIPPLGWELGYFFWGWVIDRRTRRHAPEEVVFSRLFCLLTVLAVPLAATPLFRSRGIVLTVLFLAMFASAGFVIVSLAETTQRHSTQHAAYLAGLGAGSWSGLVAVAMPIFGWLFDRGQYGTAYAIAAAAPATGWLCWRAAKPGAFDRKARAPQDDS
jgi:ACS family hexuronate transporter-like MFS transporter